MNAVYTRCVHKKSVRELRRPWWWYTCELAINCLAQSSPVVRAIQAWYVCSVENLKSRFFETVRIKWQNLNGVLWFWQISQIKTQSTLTGMSLYMDIKQYQSCHSHSNDRIFAFAYIVTDEIWQWPINLPRVNFTTKSQWATFALPDLQLTKFKIRNSESTMTDMENIHTAAYILQKLIKITRFSSFQLHPLSHASAAEGQQQ
jgi:hypothetical protein